MATVDGITVEKAQEIEDASVVSGAIVGGHLILTTGDGTTIDAGLVVDSSLLAAHEADVTTHGVTTGEIVGTAKTQTLSAKTLTTPTIASFVNATHDHSNAAGGGDGVRKVDLDYFKSKDGWTSQTLSAGSPGPKVLSSITVGEGLWIVAATHRGFATDGTATRVRVGLQVSAGTLDADGEKDIMNDTVTIHGGSTSIGLWANPGNNAIQCAMTHVGGSGSVTNTTTEGSWVAVRIGKNSSYI